MWIWEVGILDCNVVDIFFWLKGVDGIFVGFEIGIGDGWGGYIVENGLWFIVSWIVGIEDGSWLVGVGFDIVSI